MVFNLPTPPNEHYQTKQNASKTKNDKIFKKMTKKKTLLCYNATNTFQMSNECMKSHTKFNLKRRKHEKTHPFISFRFAFSFCVER